MFKRILKLFVLLILVVAAFEAYSLSRPLPGMDFKADFPAYAASRVSLPWPKGVQAAVGTAEDGLLATSGNQKTVSIASVAKVIVALAVLQQKPLDVGQQGPTLTFDSTDLEYFNYYYTHDGSVASVAVGEKISEYQALEGMLLPSANNMADSITRWAFGSRKAYDAYANKMVASMGLNDTTVKGASGFFDDTKSTAADLVKLGRIAMRNPVLVSIVEKPYATIPVAGKIHNVNHLLGQAGIVGIKTGNTDKAGGVYLFAAEHMVKGQPVTIIGSVVGAKTLGGALNAGYFLVTAMDRNFDDISLAANRTVGRLTAPWGEVAQVATGGKADLFRWKGQTATASVDMKSFDSVRAGDRVGELTMASGARTVKVPLVAKSSIAKPTFFWRLTHPKL